MVLDLHAKSVLKNISKNQSISNIDMSIDYLERGLGSRDGCLYCLLSYAGSKSVVAYFDAENLNLFKQWAYVRAKLYIMIGHLQPTEDYLVEHLLWPLVSDNEEVIDWYRQHHVFYELGKKYNGGDKDNPKNWMFFRYQSWLALNGRWDELGRRCEQILAMQDEIKKDRSYLIDHRFYLALANGDKAAMTAVLLEKVQPKLRRIRQKQESGLTECFVDSYAVIYAKLAWRHGYEIEVDTPWIPRDWLPIAPLPQYDAPWDFMKTFDIYQPLDGEWAAWSPQRPGVA